MQKLIENLKKKYWNKKFAKEFLYETVETVVTVLLMVIVIRFCIGEPRFIPSTSMLPNLQVGDRLFIEKVTGFFTTPKRGDILVFYPPCEEKTKGAWAVFTRLTGLFNKDIAYIKRVVGLPGDSIEIKRSLKRGQAAVFINGKMLYEPYIFDNHMTPCSEEMNYCKEFVIPKNNYFMMGDNRDNSRDSRYWGTLPKKNVIGKASFIFWPVTRVQSLKRD